MYLALRKFKEEVFMPEYGKLSRAKRMTKGSGLKFKAQYYAR